MKVIYIAASAVLLAACSPTPPPLCDRASIEWDKYGTAEIQQECEARYIPVAVAGYTSSDRDDRRSIRLVSDLQDSDEPAHPEKPSPVKPEKPHHKPADKPEGKPAHKKGNASANNRKGGNYEKTGHTDNGKGKGRDKGEHKNK